MQQTKRYPGVRPFETEDKNLFFGRTRDINDLSDLITLERLVVLFGKSGYGKSSLINAGIIPKLADVNDADEALLIPLVIRLGSYIEGTSITPIESVLSKLDEKAATTEGSSFLNNLLPDRPLWYHFKRKQTANNCRLILIFDQFEEFFTYPIAQQAAFKAELAELLYQDTPQIVREAATNLEKEQRRLLAQPLEIKVLFAIRADRISLLDSMKDKLPAILQKRYELRGLTEEQAKEAITKPAGIVNAYFETPPFEYTPPALSKIIDELSDYNHRPIEAFQVQIVCEEIEKEVAKGGIPDRDNNGLPDVDLENLPDFDNLYENYYRRKIQELPTDLQQSAELLIEDKLIFEDAKTREARRLSVDAGVLLSENNIQQSLLNKLESTFLLRREANSMGSFNYEVSHDTMIAPILKLKAERKAKEKAEQERLEAKRRRNRLLAIIALGALVLAVVLGVGVYMYRQNVKLQEALTIADRKTKEAEKALNDLIKAQNDKEIAEFEGKIPDIKKTMIGDNQKPAEYQKLIDYMRTKYPNDPKVQALLKEVD